MKITVHNQGDYTEEELNSVREFVLENIRKGDHRSLHSKGEINLFVGDEVRFELSGFTRAVEFQIRKALAE